LKQEDVAPSVFATDIFLYQIRSYWSDYPDKFKLAHKVLRLGFFDRQYHVAGLDLMKKLADENYGPAAVFYADFIMKNDKSYERQNQALQYYHQAAKSGYKPAEQRLSFYAALSVVKDH
jgi:hypothetical protein